MTARLQTNSFVSYITRYSKRTNNCFNGISIASRSFTRIQKPNDTKIKLTICKTYTVICTHM